jgi:cytochrome d ubiquinol oxidase subunit I
MGIRMGAAVALVAGLAVAITGDVQGKIMTDVQPMKMAAAEALYDTDSDGCAPFSLFTIGTPDGKDEKWSLTVPCVLSFLAEGDTDATVEGINDLRAEYQDTYGQDPGAAYYSPGDFTPYIPVTYWSFRFMIGLGLLTAAGAALVLWLTRKGRTPTARWFGPAVIALPVIAVLANSFGWIFTEMGRQPWAVFGLMTTAHGVSPGVSEVEAWISVIVLTLLYAVLAVIEVGLLVKYVKKGADPFAEPPDPTLHGSDEDQDRPMAFAY